MHSRHALTSSQLLMAIEQPEVSRSGHVPMSQPIDASASLSPVEWQSWSAPPQAFSIAASILVLAFSIAADVLSSLVQTVDWGSFPATTASLHCPSALVRACTYCEADFVMVALHFSWSAAAGPAKAN